LRRHSLAKKLQSQTLIREQQCKTLSHKKALRKILLKLAPGRRKFVHRNKLFAVGVVVVRAAVHPHQRVVAAVVVDEPVVGGHPR